MRPALQHREAVMGTVVTIDVWVRPGTGSAGLAAVRAQAAEAEVTGGIATSGSYERGSHLIDPQAGRAVSPAASATVTGPDLGLADALATALAVAGPGQLDLIEPLAGYEALLIGHDGSRERTAQFPLARCAA